METKKVKSLRHLTTVLFCLAAMVFAALPAGATPPVFNGSVNVPTGGNITTGNLTGPGSLCINSSGVVVTGTSCVKLFNVNLYASFQAAVTAASAGNGCVYAPPGLYSLTSTTITGDNTFCLVCAGPQLTVLRGAGSPNIALSFATSSRGSQEPYISGCTIQNTGTVGSLLTITNTTQNVTLQNATIRDTVFYQSNAAANPLVQLNLASHIIFENDTFECVQTAGAPTAGEYGLYLNGTYFVTVTKSNFSECDQGIASAKNGSAFTTGTKIIGNDFESDNEDLYLQGNTQTVISGNYMDGCILICLVDYTRGVDSIVGNTMFSDTATGSHNPVVEINGDMVAMHGNSMTQGFDGNVCVRYGDLASPQPSGLSLTGNVCNAIQGWWDVFIVGQYANTGNVIADNTMNSNGEGCVDQVICIAYSTTPITANYGYAPALVVKDNFGDSQVGFAHSNALNPIGPLPCSFTSGVWAWNPYPFNLTLYVSGGTVSEIDTAPPNGAGSEGTTLDTGITSGSVSWPVGTAARITDSVAPTTVCWAN